VEKTTPSEADNSPQLRTLERGLLILSFFDVEHPDWSFGEICRKSCLSKATVFRFLKKLEELKYLAYDQHERTYHLGPSMLRAAYLALSHTEIARVARPHLQRLSVETGEATNVAVWTGEGPIIVDAVYAPNAFKPHNLVGEILPGLASAHSRVFYAYAPENERLGALLTPHESRTKNTIVDPQELAGILAAVRQAGIAYSREEWYMGACAAAAPVFDAKGDVIASIGLVAPIERFGLQEMKRYGTAVKQAAAVLSQELGWTPPSLSP
jgi:IclR family KDG regulon transcriptional repressor